eukprot:NODE_5221_length_601_cov_415.505495.p3 GENE.NODE_5221_length_601_cov_415.505495~~NODE_5221_length_601_cov_415.505495.p3  ORF type:complete len:129 (-),score=37.48 NODE_5221_length_601_cov_415.505495:198-551(-)
MTAVDYNKQCSGLGMPRIDIIRVPLIGGGTFLHPQVSKKEVALCLIWAFHRAFSAAQESVRPQVELMPSPEMQEAHTMYEGGATHPTSQSNPNFDRLAGTEDKTSRLCSNSNPCNLL